MSKDMGFIELTTRSENNHRGPPKPPFRRGNNHIAPTDDSTLSSRYKAQQTINMVLEAARNGSPRELEALLKDGVNPSVVNARGQGPLHLALASGGCHCDGCVQDAEAIVILLLSSGRMDVNLVDELGNTALHVAVNSQLVKCAQMLISYGADVNVRNLDGEDAVMLMAKKSPQSLLHLLNESIYVEKNDPLHEKCVVRVDLRPLIGRHQSHEDKVIFDNDKEEEANSGGPFPPSQALKKGKKAKNKNNSEMRLLLNLLDTESVAKEQLLTHPVTQIFLRIKWMRIRFLFWLSFIAYMLWVILYTSYILKVYVLSCPCQNFRPSAGSNRRPESSICEIETGLKPSVVGIILGTIGLLIVEVGCFIATPRVYLRSWLNLGHWTLIFCVLGTTLPNLRSQTSITLFQYQLAAFTVFLTWMYILPQLGRFSALAKFVEMFGHVVKCFASFFVTFSSVYMAFALAFCILFFGDKNHPFANFFHSSVKVMVMMVGEMDYQEMFYGNGGGDSNNATSEDAMQAPPVLGHLLYAVFVVVVCIVLMNLFVAITVSDIQKLERKAEAARTARLIVEIFHLEAALHSKRIPRRLREFLYNLLLSTGPTFSFSPNDRDDRRIPDPLSQKALQLAEISYRKTRAQRCTRGMDPSSSAAELVELQTFNPHPSSFNNSNNHHSHSSSTSNSSQSSSPLETNSLDLDSDVRHHLHRHGMAPFRPWASCVDQSTYT